MKQSTIRAGILFIFASAIYFSPAFSGADDLMKMARSGVDEEVLQSYIESSPDTYNLSADDIITLKDLGVSSKVIGEALRHGNALDSATARTAIKEAAPSPVLSTAAASAPPAENLNISFFYESLYPYGNWLMIDGDWCWQPNATIINGEWAPYCDGGRWIYSDWGWCWLSDYSWGWAPFHYGRWFHHRHHGWCWVPDTEWGPAWVAWRKGNDYCGWAPLPPHTRYADHGGFFFRAARVNDDVEFNLTIHDYHFLPIGRLEDPHPWRHVISPDRATELYPKTSFVRNGYSFDHGHIFNHGLSVDDVSRAAGRRIPVIPVVQETIRQGQPIHRGIMRENRLFIYKPTISPAVPMTPAVMRDRLIKKQSEAQRTDDHIAHIRQFQRTETPAPLPQSKIIPRPSSDNQERIIRRQLQAQVQDEARIERQRRQWPAESAGKPMLETRPQRRAPPVERNNAGSAGEQRKSRRDR